MGTLSIDGERKYSSLHSFKVLQTREHITSRMRVNSYTINQAKGPNNRLELVMVIDCSILVLGLTTCQHQV